MIQPGLSSQSNPLSIKLENIYNTSLDNLDSQEALVLLSKFIASQKKEAKRVGTEDADGTKTKLLLRDETSAMGMGNQDQECGFVGGAFGGLVGGLVRHDRDDGKEFADSTFSVLQFQKDLDEKLLKLNQDFVTSFENVFLVGDEIWDCPKCFLLRLVLE